MDPIPGESLSGYLVRLAHRLGLSPLHLAKITGWTISLNGTHLAQNLVLGAKARALTLGRYHVSYDDIRALAHPVLRHRVLTNFRAESEGVTSDAIIDELLTAVPVPKSGM